MPGNAIFEIWKKKTKKHVAGLQASKCITPSIADQSTSHDGKATIHHSGATNAQDASTIRYGASMIQAGSARVASRPPMNLHDLMIVMRQSWGGTLILSFFLHT